MKVHRWQWFLEDYLLFGTSSLSGYVSFWERWESMEHWRCSKSLSCREATSVASIAVVTLVVHVDVGVVAVIAVGWEDLLMTAILLMVMGQLMIVAFLVAHDIIFKVGSSIQPNLKRLFSHRTYGFMRVCFSRTHLDMFSQWGSCMKL